MTIELTLKQAPATILEVTGINPSALRGRSQDDIYRLPIVSGNRGLELGECFSVSMTQDGLADHLVWHGDLICVNGIGVEMTGGTHRIEGDAGNYVGARMSGGHIRVMGSAKHFIGAEMAGGTIHVSGSVGDSAGGALGGQALGQRGGSILIDGSAGEELGCEMRRGLIAVAGSTGDRCGFLMRAGTIVVGGSAGASLGMSMKRGSILLSNALNAAPHGFVAGAVIRPPVVRLINAFLADLGFGFSLPDRCAYQQFHGDRLNGSRGEIFTAIGDQ